MNTIPKTNQANFAIAFITTPGDFQRFQGKQSATLGAKLLNPLRQWLDQMEIQNPKVARIIASLIPSQCPFERDISLFGRKIAHVPPLCKLNPLYDQLVSLRFRALCFLADECGEDIQYYC